MQKFSSSKRLLYAVFSLPFQVGLGPDWQQIVIMKLRGVWAVGDNKRELQTSPFPVYGNLEFGFVK